MDDLLATKGKLIQEYSNEIKSKDDEYVKELKRQSEEIELLADRMNKQYMAFQVSFVEELELIEKAFVEERQELISKNYKEAESLMDKRSKNEEYVYIYINSIRKFLEERSYRIEDHIEQLDLLRVQDSEEYNLVKIKLETDVQVLEQQLQQVNSYKLTIDESYLST
jgi:dynein regulatory complex protein 1